MNNHGNVTPTIGGVFIRLGRLLSVKAYKSIIFTGTANLSVCVLLFFAPVFAVEVGAQGYNFDELPIVNPQPDFNGVDPTSGSFLTESPLSLSVPGASNLLHYSIFNGVRDSFPLNIYIDDKTFAFYGQETTRQLRIHLGGTDKLFTCYRVGVCSQNLNRDGSRLEWLSRHEFVFTDRDGVVYRFFPTNEAEITWQPICDNIDYDDDFGCNHAEYEAYAYVSSIQYPSGEKLTYHDVETKIISGKTQAFYTITSNLGYKLILENSIADDADVRDTNSSWYWMMTYAMPKKDQTKAYLYYGDTLLRSLVTTRDKQVESNKLVSVVQTDDLERKYLITYISGQVKRCAHTPNGDFINQYWRYDSSVNIPGGTVSPGGVVTDVSYFWEDFFQFKFLEAAGKGTSIPVKKIRRGEYEWTYDNEALRKTITDPYQQTRSIEYAWTYSGWEYFGQNTECPSPSIVGANITNYTNELNFQSAYSYTGTKIDTASLPERNGYDYDYDNRGNLTRITQIAKPNQGLANRIIFEADYPDACENPKTCNKPAWVKDAKGNQTDYSYYPEHGGVWTVTKPAQANDVRPMATYTYTAVDTGDGSI